METQKEPDQGYKSENAEKPSERKGVFGRVNWKKILTIFIAALLLGLILYFSGYMRSRGRVNVLEGQITTLEQQLTNVQAQLAHADDRVHLMHALTLLYQAGRDLDARNFGIANTKLQQVASVIDSVKSPTIRTDELQQLQQRIAAMDIRVAADLEAQRQQINSFTEELRSLIPDRSDVAETSTPTP